MVKKKKKSVKIRGANVVSFFHIVCVVGGGGGGGSVGMVWCMCVLVGGGGGCMIAIDIIWKMSKPGNADIKVNYVSSDYT